MSIFIERNEKCRSAAQCRNEQKCRLVSLTIIWLSPILCNVGVNTTKRLTYTSITVFAYGCVCTCVKLGWNYRQERSVNWLEGIEFIKALCL